MGEKVYGTCRICFETYRPVDGSAPELCVMHMAIGAAERYASCQLCPKIETPDAPRSAFPFLGWVAHKTEVKPFRQWGYCNLCGNPLPPPSATAHTCLGPPQRYI